MLFPGWPPGQLGARLVCCLWLCLLIGVSVVGVIVPAFVVGVDLCGFSGGVVVLLSVCGSVCCGCPLHLDVVQGLGCSFVQLW